MGKRCFVLGCANNNNRFQENRLKGIKSKSLFRAPSAVATFKAWQQAIPYIGKNLTLKSYVCEDHFFETDITKSFHNECVDESLFEYKKDNIKLKPEAVPKIFPKKTFVIQKCPLYTGSEIPVLRIAIQKINTSANSNFKRLKTIYKDIMLPNKKWKAQINEKEQFIEFVLIQDEVTQKTLRIYSNLSLEVFVNSRPIKMKDVQQPRNKIDIIKLLQKVNDLDICTT